MIIDTVRGDIFGTDCKHVGFAVNTQGYNDAGFAGMVASRHWPGLDNTGEKQLGEILSHMTAGKTFHALVCHSLDKGGWDKTAEVVTKCLDQLKIPEEEPIALVLMGSGPVGQAQGADVYAIMGGIARSKKSVIIYTR